MAVTEPTTGTDTTKTATFAVKRGDRHVERTESLARKAIIPIFSFSWRARLRTPPARTAGMSLFLVDIKAARQRPRASPDPQHGEPRDERGVFHGSGNSVGEPHRRGGEPGFRYILDGSTPSAR
jgi:hypothetical protein